MNGFNALAVGLVAGLLSAQAGAGLPTGEFSCQVHTLNKKGGLVLVQADTAEQAERSAVGKEARTRSGAKSLATGVVECIENSDAQFSDVEFQRFAENMRR